jgi:hypothetical protein
MLVRGKGDKERVVPLGKIGAGCSLRNIYAESRPAGFSWEVESIRNSAAAVGGIRLCSSSPAGRAS